jgi:chitodextrinase
MDVVNKNIQSPNGQRLVDTWKKSRNQKFAGIFFSLLGAALIVAALFLRAHFLSLMVLGLVSIIAGIVLIFISRKDWSSEAAEYSMEFEDDSSLRLTALNILLQNPTMVLTGYPNLLLIFTSSRAFILPLSSAPEVQEAAAGLKDQIQQTFDNQWTNVESLEPATTVEEIERQCSRITTDFCQERISDEMAGIAWQFSLDNGKIIMFGRPLPNLPTPAILAGDTSKSKREKDEENKQVAPAPIQFKNIAITVLVIAVILTGIRLIGRISRDTAKETLPVAQTPAPEIPEIPPVADEETAPPTEADSQPAPAPETPQPVVSGPLMPPTAVKVTQRTESSLHLTWEEPADKSSIRGYEVLRNGRLIARTRNDFYNDQNLQPDTRYTYTVRSYDENRKTSAPSTPLTESTLKDTQAPSVPEDIKLTSVKQGVMVRWTASKDNVNVWGYEIYRNGKKVGTSKSTSFVDTFEGDGTFDYTVRAFDRSKNYSHHSQKATITIVDSTPPSVPSNIVASRHIDSIRLSWTASTDNRGVTSYEIYRDGHKIGTTSSTTFTDEGLKPETTYSYTIRAIDGANNASKFSEALTVKTLGDNVAPSVPGNLKVVSKTSSTVHLSWTASTDNYKVAKYEIYRDNALVGSSETNSFTDKGLTQSITYAYKIRAIDTAGNTSAFTPVIEVETEQSIVTIYYKGFKTPHIHYKKSTGLWTTSPGVAMPNAEISGYFKITIPLGYMDELIACFNDGKGIWDSNGGANYRFKEGVWTFENGNIKPGPPK